MFTGKRSKGYGGGLVGYDGKVSARLIICLLSVFTPAHDASAAGCFKHPHKQWICQWENGLQENRRAFVHSSTQPKYPSIPPHILGSRTWKRNTVSGHLCITLFSAYRLLLPRHRRSLGEYATWCLCRPSCRSWILWRRSHQSQRFRRQYCIHAPHDGRLGAPALQSNL